MLDLTAKTYRYLDEEELAASEQERGKQDAATRKRAPKAAGAKGKGG